MKLQLFMIIAVILSSLMTISQRAHAQEESSYRWLEPSIEERYNEINNTDRDHDADSGYYLPPYVTVQDAAQRLELDNYYLPPVTFRLHHQSIKPRAPPYS
ncbi:hypothetical protein [Marinomonas algarum]|uniref:Uncharacterized protein n=1 Tax=Marinomonas algarum TaxID=2883105 RepID=A0A9X1LE03_9GAMM|nr:hypothetical protein [Marinomonas algarum]MCB5160330.1 hypothetical protein [Marinomonas algarum]